MNNSYNIGGNIYTGICGLEIGRNNYLFVSNGTDITFVRQSNNQTFASMGGKFNPLYLYNSEYFHLMYEDMILTYLADNLTQMYGKMEPEVAYDNITAYVKYAENEIPKFSLRPEDLASVEDKETGCKDRCAAIAVQIHNNVMAAMTNNGKNISGINDMTNEYFTLETLYSNLLPSELNDLDDIVKYSDNPLLTVIDYLSKRPDVAELINQGYTKEAAIKAVIIDRNPLTQETQVYDTVENTNVDDVIDFEKNNVKIKKLGEYPKAGYIDTIVLCLIAQLTIFLVLLGVLYLVK